jgi:hypothetical protein
MEIMEIGGGKKCKVKKCENEKFKMVRICQ